LELHWSIEKELANSYQTLITLFQFRMRLFISQGHGETKNGRNYITNSIKVTYLVRADILLLSNKNKRDRGNFKCATSNSCH
jgi:hypothetical protein